MNLRVIKDSGLGGCVGLLCVCVCVCACECVCVCDLLVRKVGRWHVAEGHLNIYIYTYMYVYMSIHVRII